LFESTNNICLTYLKTIVIISHFLNFVNSKPKSIFKTKQPAKSRLSKISAKTLFLFLLFSLSLKHQTLDFKPFSSFVGMGFSPLSDSGSSFRHIYVFSIEDYPDLFGMAVFSEEAEPVTDFFGNIQPILKADENFKEY
jgi:hypothetical protein